MARINLLPWRQEERKRKNSEFNRLILATAILAALGVVLAYSLLNNDLEKQQTANQKIEEANSQLDVALKSIETLEAQREQMLSQMKVIQDLQGRRSIPVRVWDDIARAVPTAMYLVSIKREDDLITITGQADNANIVANLVRNLNNSEWLDGSAVVSIKSKLEAYQSSPTAPTTKNADGTESTRPVYPEDNYVEFVVTTKVQQQTQTTPEVTSAVDMSMVDGNTPSDFDASIAQPLGVEPVGSEATDATNNANASQPVPTTQPVGQEAPTQNTSAGGQ